MRDQKILQMFGEMERKIALQNMALNNFAQESSHHMNTLVVSFNAVKNLLVEKTVMTDDEINERIILEVEKAKAIPEDEIMEEEHEEGEKEEASEETETEAEEDYEEEQEES